MQYGQGVVYQFVGWCVELFGYGVVDQLYLVLVVGEGCCVLYCVKNCFEFGVGLLLLVFEFVEFMVGGFGIFVGDDLCVVDEKCVF